jgi:hypothetical protein
VSIVSDRPLTRPRITRPGPCRLPHRVHAGGKTADTRPVTAVYVGHEVLLDGVWRPVVARLPRNNRTKLKLFFADGDRLFAASDRVVCRYRPGAVASQLAAGGAG